MTTTETPERTARILVVDDERDNRELLSIVLRWGGFVVLTAVDGEQALAMLAQGEQPDLVLLDVMMPGLSGYEVLARIKGDLGSRDLPVIMISALDDHGARREALAAGASDFLPKPVNRLELLARVRATLGDGLTAGDRVRSKPAA